MVGRSLLNDLDGIDRQELVAASRRRTFARNETLFHEGDPGDTLHLVRKGYVAIRASTELGDVVTLAVLGPGEAFGELALLAEDATRTASAVALDAVETLSWRRNQVQELRDRSPDVDRFLIEILTEQVRRLSGRLVEALHLPAELRVLRRLAGLADLYDPTSEVVVVPVTQEDLASLAGTTRPTVNRVLKDAESAGLVELSRGRTTVVDRVGLAKRANRSR
jgi:CRP/FNR family cyclic AMP-dependent transcriptional regulator